MGPRIPSGFAVLGVVAIVLGAPFLFGEAGWLVAVPILEGAARMVTWVFATITGGVKLWFAAGAGVFKSAILYWHAGIDGHASPEWQGTLRVLGWLLVVGSTFFVFLWVPYRLLFRRPDAGVESPSMCISGDSCGPLDDARPAAIEGRVRSPFERRFDN